MFFIFRSFLPKLRGDFYEPSYVYFKMFPIFFDNSADLRFADKQKQIINLVNNMLSLHEQLRNINTEQQKSIIQYQIKATDSKIDKLVYELYGLNDNEIALVEGKGHDRY